eukprot:scaffold14423_cov18-Tisochrysis_lutea.AAC.1
MQKTCSRTIVLLEAGLASLWILCQNHTTCCTCQSRLYMPESLSLARVACTCQGALQGHPGAPAGQADLSRMLRLLQAELPPPAALTALSTDSGNPASSQQQAASTAATLHPYSSILCFAVACGRFLRPVVGTGVLKARDFVAAPAAPAYEGSSAEAKACCLHVLSFLGCVV